MVHLAPGGRKLVQAREVSTAAANKGAPIQLVGPFSEGATGPLTQRSGNLFKGA